MTPLRVLQRPGAATAADVQGFASCASGSSAEPDLPAAGLAARLASVGYEAVIGSRSKYRAMETRDALVEKYPELDELLGCGDNAAAADCDLVVIATPWDSAATMAQDHAHLRSTARS